MYPLAKQGVFETIQGEGSLLGTPMTFVRLAGCSIGCPQCDTDYAVFERQSESDILSRVRQFKNKWIWVTGGEPTDHYLDPLLEALRTAGRVALATSGEKRLSMHPNLIGFLSVSPHGKPDDLRVQYGSQLNLVAGLNGLDLNDWADFNPGGFEHRFVTPCFGDKESLRLCIEFVFKHPEWRLGIQAHKTWGLA